MLLSIVVPCFNEEHCIEEFHRRTKSACELPGIELEFVYVNDGSSDSTLSRLKSILQNEPRMKIVDLSRNFGKEIALTAGLDHARGDAAVPIDADLQDPPEVIPDLVEKWQEGYNVVYAHRTQRIGETVVRKATASLFYRGMQATSGKLTLPANVGDFRLIDRKALNALQQLREQHRFMKGLFTIIGFRQTAIDYERDPRFAGETKWSYWKLWNLSVEAITSFTIVPLKISTYFGLLVAILAFIYSAYIILKAILVGDPVPGFPSLIAIIALLGGVQLIVLGVIGEYLGRVFNETKQRPLYFVQDIIADDAVGAAAGFEDHDSASSGTRTDDDHA